MRRYRFYHLCILYCLIGSTQVQTDLQFRAAVRGHLATWLRSLSGKAHEVASDVLRQLPDSSKRESPTERPDPSGPSDQPLNRGSKEVLTVSNNVSCAHMIGLTIYFICSSSHRNLESGSASSYCQATFKLVILFQRAEEVAFPPIHSHCSSCFSLII